MAEKKRVDLVKIEVYDKDDWFHVDIAAKTEEMGKMLEDLLGDLIPGFPGGKEKFLKAVKEAGPPILTKEGLMAFAEIAPLQDLEAVVRDLTAALDSRKKAEPK